MDGSLARTLHSHFYRVHFAIGATPPTSYKWYPQQVRACIRRAAETAKGWKAVAALHDVHERTAWGWIKTAMDIGGWSGTQKQRGGSEMKIQDAHVAYLLSELAATPELTPVQMDELVEQKFDVRINRETVRRAMDAHRFTLKKLHRDVVNRNSDINKQKRYDYVVKFYAALANNKKIFYLDETNINLWCSRGRGWSRRGQRAVQTSVASKGVPVRFVHVGAGQRVYPAFPSPYPTPLDEVVLVLDNAPCHTSAKDVFDEAEFAGAEMPKLGPYSPMLNPIENVFSVYKSAVKRFLARQRPAILCVPEGTTITEHRAGFLEIAADPHFAEVVTPELCNRAFCHSLPHHQRALRFEDMQVGA